MKKEMGDKANKGREWNVWEVGDLVTEEDSSSSSSSDSEDIEEEFDSAVSNFLSEDDVPADEEAAITEEDVPPDVPIEESQSVEVGDSVCVEQPMGDYFDTSFIDLPYATLLDGQLKAEGVILMRQAFRAGECIWSENVCRAFGEACDQHREGTIDDINLQGRYEGRQAPRGHDAELEVSSNLAADTEKEPEKMMEPDSTSGGTDKAVEGVVGAQAKVVPPEEEKGEEGWNWRIVESRLAGIMSPGAPLVEPREPPRWYGESYPDNPQEYELMRQALSQPLKDRHKKLMEKYREASILFETGRGEVRCDGMIVACQRVTAMQKYVDQKEGFSCAIDAAEEARQALRKFDEEYLYRRGLAAPFGYKWRDPIEEAGFTRLSELVELRGWYAVWASLQKPGQLIYQRKGTPSKSMKKSTPHSDEEIDTIGASGGQ